jgi:exocyst complex component 7
VSRYIEPTEDAEPVLNASMAVGVINGRDTADEEARAEVDVLNSRLEKTAQLTKKIQACLGRLEATGKSVREVAGPLNGETRKLQVFGNSETSGRSRRIWVLR